MKTTESSLDVDGVIDTLLAVRHCRSIEVVQLSEDDVLSLCNKAKEIFLSQPMLLELKAPIKICGDIHGQYFNLLKFFDMGGFPPESRYLFLGDYVDHGTRCLETICLLFAYKVKYLEEFHLLRGNHESADITQEEGFFDECKRRYNTGLWTAFIRCFNCMPVAAIIEKKIFCCHGGLSPILQDLEEINQITRPTDIYDHDLLCDLLWSDPEKNLMGWDISSRGIAHVFGSDVVSEFLREHDLDLICRAHQVVADGYEFFAGRQLVTLISAPNHYEDFKNDGAMMTVDATLMCSFQILKENRHETKQHDGIGCCGRNSCGSMCNCM